VAGRAAQGARGAERSRQPRAAAVLEQGSARAACACAADHAGAPLLRSAYTVHRIDPTPRTGAMHRPASSSEGAASANFGTTLEGTKGPGK
jgi:hypothetical protein